MNHVKIAFYGATNCPIENTGKYEGKWHFYF
jgi:hypothetical protein